MNPLPVLIVGRFFTPEERTHDCCTISDNG